MRHRVVPLLAVLIVAAACQPRYDPDPDPTVGLTRLTPAWTTDLPDGSGRLILAEAVADGFVLVRQLPLIDLVGVVDGEAGTWRWTVPARAEDPIVKVRVAEDSLVLLRQSNTLQVYDLRTGTVRLTRSDVAAIGIGRTTVLVSNALCQPDCLVRSLDLRTGRELWKGPRAWTGNALMEPGAVFRDLHPPYDRTLRAPQPKTAALRVDGDVAVLDLATGKEVSRFAAPDEYLAAGTERTLLHWGATRDCELTLTARDTRTGKTVWRRNVASRSLERPDECSREWRPEISGERLAFVTPQGAPAVLDIGSGRVTWTAEPGAQWLGMNGQLVFAQSADQRLLTGYGVTSGDPVWKIEVPEDASGAPKTIEHLVIGDNGIAYTTLYIQEDAKEELMWVRDLESGKVRGFAEGVTPLAFDQNRLVAAGTYEMALFPEATVAHR